MCSVKNDLSLLNNLFKARFQLISMSSHAKNKLKMCSVTQHQCRRRQMCGKCSHITHFWTVTKKDLLSLFMAKFHPVHSLLSVTKNDLSKLNNLFMARFQLISMSSHAKNKLKMCSVTQDQCRRRQMCAKCSHITHFWTVTRTIYSWESFNSLVCPLMLKTNYR